jgi:hypothetical protein
VKNELKHWTIFLPVLLLILALLSMISVVPCRCETVEKCDGIRERWEENLNNLKDKIQEISTVQQTSAARLADNSTVEPNTLRTIAKQIGDALQVKDNILSRKRRECRETMNQEEQLFNELLECTQGGKNTKDKDVKNLLKKRQALIDRAVISLAEVREVEGRETVLPYSETRDDYSRSVNNYWQSYQQMYRRWGGY